MIGVTPPTRTIATVGYVKAKKEKNKKKKAHKLNRSGIAGRKK